MAATKLNVMLVEDFIYELIDKTDVFIDIFLEIDAMKRGAKEYNSFSGISNSRSITKLFEKLKKCIQYNTRHDNACRLSRVNYFDIRGINGNVYTEFYGYIFNIYDTYSEHNKYMNTIINSYNKDEISEEQYNEVKEYKSKQTFDKIKKMIELNKKIYDLIFNNLNNDDVEQFWLDRMYNNIYVKHELTKITDTELLEKITDFFEQTIRTFVYDNKQNWIDNISIIRDPKTNINDYIISVIIVFKPCVRLLSRIVDMYAICRMFKDFNLDKRPYEGADVKDQPKRANNIIIYAGDSHSRTYREFLDKMQFNKVSVNKNSKTESCIDLRNFPLPFFSMSAINNYYIQIKEDKIIKQLYDEETKLINLYESDIINKKDVITSLNLLLGDYRYYMLKIHKIYHKLVRQFRDLRQKLAELEEKQFIRSF